MINSYTRLVTLPATLEQAFRLPDPVYSVCDIFILLLIRSPNVPLYRIDYSSDCLRDVAEVPACIWPCPVGGQLGGCCFFRSVIVVFLVSFCSLTRKHWEAGGSACPELSAHQPHL